MAAEKNNLPVDDFLQYLYVLNEKYDNKMIIDTFSDFLWVERYCGYGEFEITTKVDINIIKNCRLNDYVAVRGSNVVMIVETIAVHTDAENGDTLVISGRSLESLLDRRIITDDVVGKIDDDGTAEMIGVQEAIKTIVMHNVVEPTNEKRAIPNFIFKESEDPRILELEMESFQDTGANLYEKVSSICKDKNLGFRVNAIDGGGFEFELYFGQERTWDNENIIPVVFSDSYENLSNSNYLQSEKDYKSVVYVKWEWKYGSENSEIGGTELTEIYRTEERVGLARREISTSESGSIDIPTYADIKNAVTQIVSKGKEFLADYKVTTLFEGEINPYRQFIYGIDYNIGDVVQLENKYGQSGKCRITEISNSRDASGVKMTPTFEKVEDDEEEKEDEESSENE